MSEEPNTAAIRAGYGPVEGARVSAAIGCILALCDALDAARAQLDVYRGHCDHAQTAERWEAAADTYNNYRLAWKARAEAAEARITAVERLRDAWNTSIPTMHLAESLNLALIEGSE